jgi:hypothetical protein
MGRSSVRADQVRVWTRRAEWAWEYYARDVPWHRIAARDLGDKERWREVKRRAIEAVAVGCGAGEPRATLRNLREMMTAFLRTRPAEPAGAHR